MVTNEQYLQWNFKEMKQNKADFLVVLHERLHNERVCPSLR